MTKTIILTEQQHKILIKQSILESMGILTFGKEIYNVEDINKLKKVINGAYTLRIAENHYQDWANVGFDKNTKEYTKWCVDVEYFMNAVIGGIVKSIENTKQRPTAMFQHLILDREWLRIAIQGGDRLKDTGDNDGSNTGYRCLYTLVAAVYQNKCMWNDFFFNPVFKKFPLLMSQLTAEAIKKGPDYKQLLPLEMIRELNSFKADKSNAQPELFYDPDWENGEYANAEMEKQKQDLANKPFVSIDDMD